MDFGELVDQARMVEEQLGELLERLQNALQPEQASAREFHPEPVEEDLVDSEVKEYEGRFLDLFKKSR